MARFKYGDKAFYRGEEVEIKQSSTNYGANTTKYTLTTGEVVNDEDLSIVNECIEEKEHVNIQKEDLYNSPKKFNKKNKKNKGLHRGNNPDSTIDNQ